MPLTGERKKQYHREYHRKYHQLKKDDPEYRKRRLENNRKYYERNSEKKLAKNREYYKNHPELRTKYYNPKKSRARRKAVYYLQKGIIERKNVCELCKKNDKKLEMHHEDYDKPLQVTFLCRSCHHRLHGVSRMRNV